MTDVVNLAVNQDLINSYRRGRGESITKNLDDKLEKANQEANRRIGTKIYSREDILRDELLRKANQYDAAYACTGYYKQLNQVKNWDRWNIKVKELHLLTELGPNFKN